MKKSGELYLEVDIGQQQMRVWQDQQLIKNYVISTAVNGAGEEHGSGCTPRGWHQVRALIGRGQALNTVYVARRPTGEIYSAALRADHPERDWILSRILWLSGLEKGLNRMGNVDTMQRLIYIHGAPDDEAFGEPVSHGCVRMKNNDIMELFDMVSAGTRVLIHE